MENLKLSVLHLEPPDQLKNLVITLDELGYHRFWATEHHSNSQSASPLIVAALAASHTKRMRVGTAGVLLQLYSPVRVVEHARVLEYLFRGRIDIGIAGAVPGGPVGRVLLDELTLPNQNNYPAKVRELARLMRLDSSLPGELDGALLGPRSDSTSELWLCGTSARSARLAGELGLAYAYHHYQGPVGCGQQIVQIYLDSFKPNQHMSMPRFNIACFGICAENCERANNLWMNLVGPSARPANFCGTPVECHSQLREIQDYYNTEEIVVSSCASSYEDRLKSYQLLASMLPMNSLLQNN